MRKKTGEKDDTSMPEWGLCRSRLFPTFDRNRMVHPPPHTATPLLYHPVFFPFFFGGDRACAVPRVKSACVYVCMMCVCVCVLLLICCGVCVCVCRGRGGGLLLWPKTCSCWIFLFFFLSPGKMAFYGAATVTTDGSPWLKVLNFFIFLWLEMANHDSRWSMFFGFPWIP